MVIEETSYCGTGSMPMHLKFFLLAGMVAADWDKSPDVISEGAETAASNDSSVLYISHETNLDEQEALRFLAKLRPLLKAMNDDSMQAIRTAVCVPDLIEWSTARTINALNQLDDINEAVYQMYYLMAQVQLSEKEHKALESLLEGKSFSASYARTDFAEAYKGNPEGAKINLLRLCSS